MTNNELKLLQSAMDHSKSYLGIQSKYNIKGHVPKVYFCFHILLNYFLSVVVVVFSFFVILNCSF